MNAPRGVRSRGVAESRVLAPVSLALITAGLGIFGIADKSLSLDEIYSLIVDRQPLAQFVTSVLGDLETAVYFVLLWPWLRVFGEGEARCACCRSSWGSWRSSRPTPSVGVTALALRPACCSPSSPVFVEFMQEARHYTLLVAWSALATLAYLRVRDKPTLANSLIYVALAGSMVYVHILQHLVMHKRRLAAGDRDERVKSKGALLGRVRPHRSAGGYSQSCVRGGDSRPDLVGSPPTNPGRKWRQSGSRRWGICWLGPT